MSTDVKLDAGDDGTWVVVQGHAFKIDGADLMLDSLGRRKSDHSNLRRALVHDFQDGLTLNWAGDYPGGVTIHGKVTIPLELVVEKLTIRGEVMELESRVGVDKPFLMARPSTSDVGGIPSPPVPPQSSPARAASGMAERARHPDIDLMAEIKRLRARVAALEAKVSSR